MNQHRTELMVGVLVFVSVSYLIYVAARLGQTRVFAGPVYLLYADFASVSGLEVGDPVEIAGVKVGRVESISLADYQARVTFRIQKDVQIHQDAIAAVRTRGIIGDRFVMIRPGAADRLLRSGDEIRNTKSASDLVSLLGELVAGDLI
jgi:phospholipid/cholesterol/gamma-HCH transport system substrate-binding protein